MNKLPANQDLIMKALEEIQIISKDKNGRNKKD